MNIKLDPELISEMRSLYAKNEHTSMILNFLSEKISLTNKFHFVMYFMEAYNLSITQASPILAWEGFGGELTSEKVNSFVDPILYQTSKDKPSDTH